MEEKRYADMLEEEAFQSRWNNYRSEYRESIGPLTIRSVETGSPQGGFGKDGVFHDKDYLPFEDRILA